MGGLDHPSPANHRYKDEHDALHSIHPKISPNNCYHICLVSELTCLNASWSSVPWRLHNGPYLR